MKILEAFKAAFDSLVRTYSPMIVGSLVGLLSALLPEIPEEVSAFVALLVSLLFMMLWYAILRVIEIIRGKASKLLGLGLVKTDPTYDLVPAVSLPDGTQMWATRSEYHRYLRGLEADADEQFARP